MARGIAQAGSCARSGWCRAWAWPSSRSRRSATALMPSSPSEARQQGRNWACDGFDDVGERAADTGSESADALGAEGCGASGLADADGEPVGPVAGDQGDAEDGEQRSRDRRRGVRRHACPSGPATLCGTGWVVWAISPGFPQSTRAGSPIRGWTRSSRLARVLCRSVNDPPHGIGKHVEYTFVTPIVGPPSAEVVPAPKKRTRGFSVMTTWRSEP